MQTISVSVRRNYGQLTIYPACDFAKLLADIAGTKTLTSTNIATAVRHGYPLVVADGNERDTIDFLGLMTRIERSEVRG